MDTITLTTWKAPATPSTYAAGPRTKRKQQRFHQRFINVKREPITNIR